MTITWNTDVNAPCCPGEILAEDGRSVLVQTDWDYPSVAQSFGWSTRNVQRCPECNANELAAQLVAERFVPGLSPQIECQQCGEVFEACDHSGTDGSIDCLECGVTASEFITAAGDWLRENDGVTADDPGYFQDGEG